MTFHRFTPSPETRLHEETYDMTQTSNEPLSRWNPRARAAASLLVAVSFAITFGVSGASGAEHSHAKSVVISTSKSAKYGTILVSGKTLYTLQPNNVSCAAACQKFWVEVLLPKGVTKATAGPGVSAAKLGTTKGAGGALQVTYGGKALFWFSKDKAPGKVTGNATDTWGKWSDVVLVKPTGKKPTTTTTVSGGGGGVGF
jgi:predicted lipoprotein with Yx(FWY)xxD motif